MSLSLFARSGWRGLAVASLLTVAGAAQAALVTVLPSDPLWGSPAGENNTGGSSAITATMPRTAGETGSLELTGGRTRFFGLGNPYSSASNLGLLSQVTAFAFDWMIAIGSTNPYNDDYTPALRLHVWDGTQRSELIWEGAYNGVYGTAANGTWYSSSPTANFWRFQAGFGETLQPVGGALALAAVSDWATGNNNAGNRWYSDDAYVAAISIGVGGGATANYRAFADNVVFNIAGNERTFNFEMRAPVQVPEPASLALVGMALAALGFAGRRRKA